MFGVFGSLFPDSKMQIIFLPMLSFTAASAIKGVLLLDTVGLVAGWQMFDHAAHLGGLLFGLWWVYQGNREVWGRREAVMRWWHQNVRGEDKRPPPKAPPGRL